MFTTSVSDPGTSAKSLLHDPPDNAAVAHAQRTTCEMIAQVFPAPTLGQVFFERFVERAGREPSTLPGESEDAVCICTKSIATLARELKLSNDTTQKYVVLYMALGLLKKRKFLDHQIAFVLSTGIYSALENLEASLDYLIQKKTSRPKLRTMAVEVKARCRIYGLISQDLVGSLEQLQALLHTDKGTSRRTLEQRLAQAQYITSKILTVVLTSHFSAESTKSDGTRGRANLPNTGWLAGDTQHQENQESTQLLHVGRQGKERPSQNLSREEDRGDSPHHRQDEESPQENQSGRFSGAGTSSRLPEKADLVDSLHTSRKGESPQDGTSGRFAEMYRSMNLPGSPSQGDSAHDERESESPQVGTLGRFVETYHSTNLPGSPSQGDSVHDKHKHESIPDGKLGRFSQPGASSRLPQTTGGGDSGEGNLPTCRAESTQDGKMDRREDDHLRSNLPDLSRQVDSGSGSRNVNVLTIYNIITSTLREPQQVAEFLAEQLEGDRRVSPKYQKLFHVQPGQARDPRVLAAAFICTMVRLHRDRWNLSHPGGFFTKRCREYDAGVPEEVEGWLESYGQLSLTALLETLAKQRPPGRAPVLTTPVSSLKPAPKPLLPPLTLASHLQIETARMVMSKQEAEDLCDQVACDRRTQLFRTKRLRLGKEIPRYAVLVDASVPGGPPRHQTVVYSHAEWQGRLDSMKTWRDLIYPTPASGPPLPDTANSSQGKETIQ